MVRVSFFFVFFRREKSGTITTSSCLLASPLPKQTYCCIGNIFSPRPPHCPLPHLLRCTRSTAIKIKQDVSLLLSGRSSRDGSPPKLPGHMESAVRIPWRRVFCFRPVLILAITSEG